jgi:MoaA/NifB/PqqE/SkfB family radical SAM enzyme
LVSDRLETVRLLETINDAAEMGYKVLSFSGGEPFLYDELKTLLSHAKSLGFHTSVTTNGFFLDDRHLDPLGDLIDVLAVSLDGPPDYHNHMRGSNHAFSRLTKGLENIRERKLNFGFIHTLTQSNWEHIEWVFAFAADNGAKLLQIHPLELVGRATSEMTTHMPTDDILERLYLMCFILGSRYQDRMFVQLDVLCRDDILADPDLIYASEELADCEARDPAELLSLIVLQTDGSLVPLSHGFDRRYEVCNIHQQRLRDAWPRYFSDRYTSFRQLCRRVYHDISCGDEASLFNWHELISSYSHL